MSIYNIQPIRIYIYYVSLDEYEKIKDGTKKFVAFNDNIYIDVIDNSDPNILFGYIGINGKPHTKNGIVHYSYYMERQSGRPGVFTTDGLTFYEILDFFYAVDERVQIRLLKINSHENITKIDAIETRKTAKKKRITVRITTRALLQKEINSKCPFCDSEDVDHFHIHHIDENPDNNEFSNLIMVCPLCHSKITKGNITKEEVVAKKKSLQQVKNENKILPFQQVNYGDKNLQIINPANIEINQNTTKVIKNVVQPTGEHINEEQAFIIKRLIDEIVEIQYTGSRARFPKSKYYPEWWKKLCNRFRITSYKLIPREKFEEAESWLHQQVAILRPKLRRTDKNEWRNQHYKAIYTKANSLNLTKEELYQLAFDKLLLKNYISSLKDLKDSELKKFYDKIMRM